MAQTGRPQQPQSETLQGSINQNPEIFTVRSFAIEVAKDESLRRRELALDSLLYRASNAGDTLARAHHKTSKGKVLPRT